MITVDNVDTALNQGFDLGREEIAIGRLKNNIIDAPRHQILGQSRLHDARMHHDQRAVVLLQELQGERVTPLPYQEGRNSAISTRQAVHRRYRHKWPNSSSFGLEGYRLGRASVC